MPVNVIAGCMAATRAPTARAGSRTASPCRPEVCTTCWPSWSAPLSASILTTLREHVVGHGEQQQVAGPRDRGRLAPRRHPASSSAIRRLRGVGLTRGGHDLVAGGAERSAQDGADAACADDTHAHAESS